MGDDGPGQVRIRTDPDDGYAHRYDTIQHAKETFDVGNNTDAILNACDLAGQLLPALQDALEEADIRPSEKQAIAEAVSTRRLSVDVDSESVTISAD